MSSVWNEQPRCSKALHVSGHIPFMSKYIFKYIHNLNPLRWKTTTKLRISGNQSSENLSFPNPLLSVSSTALTIPLTTQTHLHLPSCSPILCFPNFSLTHLLALPSILGSLPHSSGKPTHARKQTSVQLIKDSSLILTLLWPDLILQSTGIFFREEHSVLEGAWCRGSGLLVQEVFLIQVSNLILRKQQWPPVLSRRAQGAGLANEGCHMCWHSKGSRIGCC